MATNLFTRAAAYRKKHPHLSQVEAVKAVAKSDKKSPARKKTATKKKAAPKKRAATKKKAAPRKKTAHKKAVGRVKRRASAKPKAPTVAKRKVKIKLKKSKGGISLGISGVSMSKIHTELAHQHSLNSALTKHKDMLKGKGLTAGEKQKLRREIEHYKNCISASKSHVSVLKRSI